MVETINKILRIVTRTRVLVGELVIVLIAGPALVRTPSSATPPCAGTRSAGAERRMRQPYAFFLEREISALAKTILSEAARFISNAWSRWASWLATPAPASRS